MSKLYPIQCRPLFKEKVWGGQKLRSLYGKDFSPKPNCGESWELSGVNGDVSVVVNGFLQGNDLQELAEVYMGDLVGEKVFSRYGSQFPLLIKFLDTTQALSVQVHPPDSLAMQRHGSSGKTEMWYVLHADPGAEIIAGLKPGIDKEDYLLHLQKGTLREILHAEPAHAGDVFFIPAGRIHAIGAGITLCEIQQTSDVTYRVYDWDRPGLDGQLRALHTDEALDAINFSPVKAYKEAYMEEVNTSVRLVSCLYFATNLIAFDKKIACDYYFLDSFVIYICTHGSFTLHYPGGAETFSAGQTVLVPAEIKQTELIPDSFCRILEVYVA